MRFVHVLALFISLISTHAFAEVDRLSVHGIYNVTLMHHDAAQSDAQGAGKVAPSLDRLIIMPSLIPGKILVAVANGDEGRPFMSFLFADLSFNSSGEKAFIFSGTSGGIKNGMGSMGLGGPEGQIDIDIDLKTRTLSGHLMTTTDDGYYDITGKTNRTIRDFVSEKSVRASSTNFSDASMGIEGVYEEVSIKQSLHRRMLIRSFFAGMASVALDTPSSQKDLPSFSIHFSQGQWLQREELMLALNSTPSSRNHAMMGIAVVRGEPIDGHATVHAQILSSAGKLKELQFVRVSNVSQPKEWSDEAIDANVKLGADETFKRIGLMIDSGQYKVATSNFTLNTATAVGEIDKASMRTGYIVATLARRKNFIPPANMLGSSEAYVVKLAADAKTAGLKGLAIFIGEHALLTYEIWDGAENYEGFRSKGGKPLDDQLSEFANTSVLKKGLKVELP